MKMLQRLKNNILLISICVLLTSIPFIFWGNLRFIGGDDTRLYYFLPLEYLQNYARNIISDNSVSAIGSYFSLGGMYGLVGLILLLKYSIPFLDTQLLMFGLNISLGFLAFYVLLGNWIGKDKWYDVWIKIIAGLFFTLSTFIYFTLYGPLWPAMYLVSVAPFTLHCFIRAIKTAQPVYIVLGSIIFALWGNVTINIPWFFGLLISLIPLLSLIFIQHTKRFFLYTGMFMILVILMGSYYVVPFFHAPLTASKGDTNVVYRTVGNNKAITDSNKALIRAVSQHNNVLYPLLNVFHKNLQIDHNWSSYKNYKTWSLSLLPLNSLFLCIIGLAAFYRKKVSKQLQYIYNISLLSFIITIYFFTVNIGEWGLPLFLSLNEHVPGFSMFRNMYDKFGLAVAFSYAFLLALSLKIILDSLVRDHLKKIILVFVLGMTLLNSKSFILGENFQLPFRGTEHTYDRITDFNKDYYQLMSYIKNMPNPSKIAWLPLVDSNYIPIQDATLAQHYYLGPSPQQIIAQKGDYTGALSFFNSELLKKYLSDLTQHDKVGEFFQHMNVKYIVVLNEIPQDLEKSSLYSLNKFQTKEFYNTILGNKIADFGTRYSLYTINPLFDNDKLYLTSDINRYESHADIIQYEKIDSYKYTISLRSFKGSYNLAFLDIFHKLWKLHIVPIDNPPKTDLSYANTSSLFDETHAKLYNYANTWTLNSDFIINNVPKDFYRQNPDGSIDINLVLYFTPQLYNNIALCLSIIGVFISSIYCIYIFIKPRRYIKNRSLSQSNSPYTIVLIIITFVMLALGLYYYLILNSLGRSVEIDEAVTYNLDYIYSSQYLAQIKGGLQNISNITAESKQTFLNSNPSIVEFKEKNNLLVYNSPIDTTALSFNVIQNKGWNIEYIEKDENQSKKMNITTEGAFNPNAHILLGLKSPNAGKTSLKAQLEGGNLRGNLEYKVHGEGISTAWIKVPSLSCAEKISCDVFFDDINLGEYNFKAGKQYYVEFKNVGPYNIAYSDKYKVNYGGYMTLQDIKVEQDIDLKMLASSDRLQIPTQLDFKKINPTKYVVNVSGANKDYILNFLEQYNLGWRIRVSQDHQLQKGFLNETNHIETNGSINGWVIKKSDISAEHYSLIIEFLPAQSLAWIPTVLKMLVIIWFGYIMYKIIKKKTL